MAAKKITITMTEEREKAFQLIWERLPHLQGSHSATIDYLLTKYLDESPARITLPPVEMTISTESVEPEEENDDLPINDF